MPVICRLRELIDDRGLKQLEVAVATKLSPTIIGNLYHNQFQRIDCKTAEKLCRYFGCTLGDLFQVTDMEETALKDTARNRIEYTPEPKLSPGRQF